MFYDIIKHNAKGAVMDNMMKESSAKESSAKENLAKENLVKENFTKENENNKDNKRISSFIKDSRYERYICSFLVIAASIILFFLIYKFDKISVLLSKVLNALQPIMIGLVIAYLINPVVCFFEKNILKICAKLERKIYKSKNKKGGKKDSIRDYKKFARGMAILLSLIILIVLITSLFLIVVPELVNSIYSLVKDIPEMSDKMEIWFTSLILKLGIDDEAVYATGYSILEKVENWLTTDFSLLANNMLKPLTSGLMSVIGVAVNFLIGLIISIYVLNGKERLGRMCKKILYAYCSKTTADNFLVNIKYSDKVFGGFISGKIIDSLIIGIICFVCLNILQMPYTLIVSVVVGVTNIIPFFGPYFGAVPSAILILIADPIKGFYFIIFVIILQQFDGNVLGPKILGDSTGLSAFWVIFAILVGNGLFGMIGLVAGVPAFAVIYGFTKQTVDRRLKRKGINIK